MRASYLLHTEQQLVDDFAATVADIFRGNCPYLVGSATKHSNYRDIDLRVMLDDKEFDRLRKMVNTEMLGIAISLWGQKATGLPIDFQIQRRSNANLKYPMSENLRWAKGIRPTAGVRLDDHEDNKPIRRVEA